MKKINLKKFQLIKSVKKNKLLQISLIILLVSISFLGGVLFTKVDSLKDVNGDEIVIDSEKVIPEKGFELPISWGDLGPRLIEIGVIDKAKFLEVVNLNSDEEKMLLEGTDKNIIINSDNSQFVVDFLWAIGLAQKSLAYETGPLGTDYKKDVGNFASTGGWGLAKGEAVDYLGKYDLFDLSIEQHKRVEEIAKNVYRPCCGNSTWFPDCNHGMAALAAIEMMVSKNLSDNEIYANVLKLNSFWFPSTYMTTAKYFQKEGKDWSEVDPKIILSEEFSSGRGAAEVANKVDPVSVQGGGGCGA